MSNKPQEPHSFRDTLIQTKELISGFRTVQDEVSSELTGRRLEMDELSRTHGQVEQLLKQFEALHGAQLHWEIKRQELAEEHDRLRKSHEELVAIHAGTESELAEAVESRNQVRKVYEESRQALATAEIMAEESLKASFEHMSQLRYELHQTKEELHQLQRDRTDLAETSEAEQLRLRERLSGVSLDLDSAREAHARLTAERDALQREREAARVQHAQADQDWQAAEGRLNEQKKQLSEQVTELQQMLELTRTRLNAQEAAQRDWEAEQRRLSGELSRLQQEAQEREDAFQAERKRLVGELVVARQQLGQQDEIQAALKRVEEEQQRLTAERAALREQLVNRQAELDSQRNAQARLIEDRDAVQRDRDAVEMQHAQQVQGLEQAQGRLIEQKAELADQIADVQEQLGVTRAKLPPLEAAQLELQSERARLQAELDRFRDETREKEAAYQSERKRLVADLVATRQRLSEEEQLHRSELDGPRKQLLAANSELEALRAARVQPAVGSPTPDAAIARSAQFPETLQDIKAAMARLNQQLDQRKEPPPPGSWQTPRPAGPLPNGVQTREDDQTGDSGGMTG